MTRKYIVRLENIMLKTLDEAGVRALIEAGDLHPRDYIFDCRDRKWLTSVEAFGISGFSDEQAFERPTFTPPLPPTKTYSEGEYGELLELLKVARLNLNNKLSAIDALKLSRKDLELNFQRLAGEKIKIEETLLKFQKEEDLLRSDLMQAREENIELADQVKNLELQVEDLLKMKDELLEFRSQLDEQQIQLREELEYKEKNYEILFEENAKVATELNEAILENEKLKKKMEIYRDYVATEKKRSSEFESNISKLNQGIVKLKTLRKKDQNMIANLENYKKTQANKEARELQRLIGDSFEIDNSPHWFIEMEGEVKGPFSFHDMKSLQKFSKIIASTPVKKRSDTFWTTAGQDFELSAKLIIHSEIDGGIEQFRYFVDRSDYRAPFHGAATIEFDGLEFKGFCTSLSVGGAFIELPELNEELIEKGSFANLKIHKGTLSQEFSAEIVIRNHSNENPCGIGIQFKGLIPDQEEIIISYVASYLENSKKTA